MTSEATAVIPARNEAGTIRFVVEQVRTVLEHVIVVDDGSVDETARLAGAAGAFVVSHSTPRGYGPSLRTGFSNLPAATSHCVTIDADGAHLPADLPSLLRVHCDLHHDLTIGNRFARKSDCSPSPKRWANLFAALLVNLLLGTSFDDVACGLRVYSRWLTRDIAELPELSGFRLAYDAIWLAIKRRAVVGSSPVSVVYDASELCSTSRGELIDLVQFAKARSPSEYSAPLHELHELLVMTSPITVVFDNETLCLHPIDKPDSYVFQRQPPSLRGKHVGSVVRLLVSK